MRVAAPGKLLLTGAYAVLEGAPAIVVAVDRVATADTEKNAETSTREVELAFGANAAPYVDAAALFDGARKLGLGSSAAVLVAALAARKARGGADLASPCVRAELFAEARAAHAASQGGGSGADVAASVFGGVLRYSLAGIAGVSLPRGLHLAAYFSGTSARTSELRAAVDELRTRQPTVHRECIEVLRMGAELACQALSQGRLDVFLAAADVTRNALARLGVASGAPIVPEQFVTLARFAARTGAVFLPSGAGGGDVGVFLGRMRPSRAFEDLAEDLGFTHVPLSVDPIGVRRLASGSDS